MRGMRSLLWALVCLLTLPPNLLLPAIASAQQPRPAGVVTGLKGQATVARATQPRPLRLQFKDDVFFQDTVTTERGAVVKVLLGGKALVTIRELSDFTIIEGANKATVNLGLGRLALETLRRLMAPGEEFEVRTPNAIAAVRGSFVIVDVAMVSGVPATTVYALQITAPVTVTSLVTGVSVTLPPNSAVSLQGLGAGARMGPVVPIPPDQARELAKTADVPRQDQHNTRAPANLTAQIGNIKTQEAAQLAAALGGGAGTTVQTADASLQGASAGVTTGGQGQGPPGTGLPTTGVLSPGDIAAWNVATAYTGPKNTNAPGAPVAPIGPFFLIEDSVLVVPPGTPLARFNAGAPVPAARGYVGDLGLPPGPPYDFSTCSPPGTPCAPVLAGTGPSHNVIGDSGGPALEIRDTTLTTPGPGPVVLVDGTSLVTNTLLQIDPSHLALGGPLLTVQNAGIVAGVGPLISVQGGSTITTGGNPLILVDAGSAVTAAGPFLDISGAGSSVNTGTGPVLKLQGGSTAANAIGPALRMTGGTLAADALVGGDDTGNTVALAGPVVDLTNANVTLRVTSTLGATDRLGLVLGPNVPAVQMASSTLTIQQPEDLVTFGAPSGPVPTIAGTAVRATGTPATPSTINLQGSLLYLQAADMTATLPLVSLSNTAVAQSGGAPLVHVEVFPGLTTTMAGPLLAIANAPAPGVAASGELVRIHDGGAPGSLLSATGQPFVSVDASTVTSSGALLVIDTGVMVILGGPLLSVTGGSSVSPAGNLLTIQGGATVTGTGTGAFIQVSGAGTTVTPGWGIWGDDVAFLTGGGSQLTLAGPLLSVTAGGTVTGCDGCLALLDVESGATVTGQGTAPFIQVDGAGSSLTAGGYLVNLTDIGSALTLPGPLLSVTNGGSVTAIKALYLAAGAAVTGTGAAPFVQVDGAGSSLGASATLIYATDPGTQLGLTGPLLSVKNGATANLGGVLDIWNGAAVALGGPLLTMSGGVPTVTVGGDVLTVDNASTFTGPVGQPLINVAAGSLSVRGGLANLAGSGTTLGGPILVQTGGTVWANGLILRPGASLGPFAPTGGLFQVSGGVLKPEWDTLVEVQSGASLTFTGPALALSGTGSVDVPSGPLVNVWGTLTQAGPQPFILVTDTATLNEPNTLVQVRGALTLGGPLLTMSSGTPTVTVGGDLLNVDAASTFAGPVGQPLINVGAGALTAIGALANLAGAGTTLSGPLLTQSGGSISAGTGLTLAAGASLTPAGSVTLFQATGGTLSLSGALVDMTAGSSAITLSGPLFSGTNGSGTVLATDLIDVFGGSALTGNATEPSPNALVQLDTGSSLTAGSPTVKGRILSVMDPGSSATLARPVLSASNSSTVTLGDAVVIVYDGGTVTSSTTDALVKLDHATLTIDGPFPCCVVFYVAGATNPASASLAGPLLRATAGASVSIFSNILDIETLGRVTGTGGGAFIQVDGTGIPGSTTLSTGAWDLVRVTGPGAGTQLTLAGPLLSVTNGGSVSAGTFLLGVDNGAAVAGTGTAPFIQASDSGTSLNTGSHLVWLSDPGTTLTLAGPLLSVAGGATITIPSSELLSINNGASVSGTGSAPFIQVSDSGTSVTTGFDFVSANGSGTPASATLTLAGPLLSAAGGSGVSVGNALLYVGNGAAVAGTGTAPFIQVTGTGTPGSTTLSVPNSHLVPVYGTGAPGSTTLALAGPLLSVTNGGSVSTSGVLLYIQRGATASNGTSTAAFIQVDGSGSSLSAGWDLANLQDPGSQLALAGPLLSVTGGGSVSVGNILEAKLGAAIAGTGTAPFLQVDGAAASLAMSWDLANLQDPGSQLALAGPLLSVTGGGSVNLGNALLDIWNGAAVNNGGSTAPFIQVVGAGSSLAAGGTLAWLQDPGTQLTLAGPLLSVTGGGSVSAAGAVLAISNGAAVNNGGSTAPFIQVVGTGLPGSTTLSTATWDLVHVADPGTQLTLGGPLLSVTNGGSVSVGGTALVTVTGVNTAVDGESGLTLGTDRPLQISGAVLAADSGATLSGARALHLDTVLLDASAPLLNLTSGATVTTTQDAINLVQKVNLNGTAAALVKLDASTLIINGSLFNVAGGSKLKTAGDLLQMGSNATLNITNGTLLLVAGNSYVSLTGNLVNFTGRNSTINISNSLAPTGYLNGIPVFSSLGGTAGFTVTRATPLANLNTSGNKIVINGAQLPTGATSGMTGSLIRIGPGGGTVKIQ